MKEAGFSIVAFGIESGNNEILKLVNKGITQEMAIKAIKDAIKAGLSVEGLFMIGNIGETKETIEDTICFAKKYNPPYNSFRRTGYSGFSLQRLSWFQVFIKAKDYGRSYPSITTTIPIRSLFLCREGLMRRRC